MNKEDRKYFAAKAMQAILSNYEELTFVMGSKSIKNTKSLAEASFKIADSMMEKLNEKDKT